MAVYYTPPVKKTTDLHLDCDGDEHKLDIGEHVPARTALMLADVYLNVDSFTLKDPAKPGRLRIWMRRAAWKGEPTDDTFFYDVWLERAGYGTLDTRAMFEKADSGRLLTWRYKVTGASAVALSTRFVKYAQIS